MPPPTGPSDRHHAIDELTILVKRAEAGDPADVVRLREALRGQNEVWAELAALVNDARSAWAEFLAGGDVVRQTAILQELDRAAGRLTRPGAGPLERLLAQRVALAADRSRHFREGADCMTTGIPVGKSIRALERRAKRAERGHAAAVRMLDDYRKRLTS